MGIQHPHGEVVHKKERARALNQDVVDAMRNDVNAHRIVLAGHESQLQLRAHAVHAGDEHGLLNAFEIGLVHGAKGADVAQYLVVERALHQRLNGPEGRSGGIDIDARIAVTQPRLIFTHERIPSD
jgi:hypothetical protein